MTPAALNHCQVSTPPDVVAMMWRMARARRATFETVLDLGSGDCRFAKGRESAHYVGYEIDVSKLPGTPAKGCRFVNSDVLECREANFSLAIGNPPYIRRALLGATWRDKAADLLASESGGIRPRADSNGFLYFMWLALLRTLPDGLVVQLVPVEWVSRPSASPLRHFITSNKWNVDIYRFTESIFDRVLTTAAIVIIDKSQRQGTWNYFSIDRTGAVQSTPAPSNSGNEILQYGARMSDAYALRGLSPGGQDIYVLTEESRLLEGLKVDVDVTPCVTTLRYLDSKQLALTKTVFNKAFVEHGLPCWLIRSDRDVHSASLQRYLESVSDRAGQYTTNRVRGEEWFRYRIHPSPDILVASGFRARGPKVFKNEASAIALGSVYGVFVKGRERQSQTVKDLRTFDFESHIVAHSNGLQKIEVRQLNTVLAQLAAQ
nr:hypothetical protein [uncultured Rhodoferax sp.]